MAVLLTIRADFLPFVLKPAHHSSKLPDSALSSRERSVSSPGLRWIVMAVVVTVPWTRATLGLALFVCAGNHSGSQCTTGQATQDDRDVGASDD
jgi:hypothetical protein